MLLVKENIFRRLTLLVFKTYCGDIRQCGIGISKEIPKSVEQN